MPIPYTFDAENHIVHDLKGNFIPTTTQVMEAMHLSFDFRRFVVPDVLDRRGRIGTAVHNLTDIYDRDGSIDPTWLDMDTHGFVDSYIGFRRISGFVPQSWSTRHCELINGLPLSGEEDKFGLLNGHRCLIDLKTGAKSDSHGIQLVSYEMLRFRSTRVGRIIRAVLHLHADGAPGTLEEYPEHSRIDGTSYADVFLAAHHCLHWSMRRGYFSEKDFLENK